MNEFENDLKMTKSSNLEKREIEKLKVVDTLSVKFVKAKKK